MHNQWIGRRVAMIAAVGLAAGCTATTHFSSTQPEAAIAVKESTSTALPRSDEFSTTSFGNYEFKAEAEGFSPFYGILPLKFNGGYLALDILFFAPAAFFNLREPFPFYEFDLEERVIRYKQKDPDAWIQYRPSPVEALRAQEYFDPAVATP